MVDQIEYIVTGEAMFLGRPLLRWYIGAGAFAVFLIVMMLLRFFGNHRYKALKSQLEQRFDWKIFTYFLLGKISFWASFFVAVYIGSEAVNPIHKIEKYFHIAFLLAGFWQIFLWTNSGINIYSHQKLRYSLTKDPTSSTAINLFSLIWKFAAFTILFIIMLDQMGFNVTTLLAGLGVGGIAVALALQNILGDLFASLTIVFDKPFRVGDTIKIDQLTGTIEHVGLKTTRIRSLHGEQVIMSNTDILKTRLHNFYQIQERRVQFNIGVTYDTPIEKMKLITQLLRSAVLSQAQTRVDRVYFKEYAESSLNFELTYVVIESDLKKATDIQHEVNLEILRIFEENKISFAFPSRTIYLQGQTPAQS